MTRVSTPLVPDEFIWSEVSPAKDWVLTTPDVKEPSFTVLLNKELKRLNLARPQLLALLRSVA